MGTMKIVAVAMSVIMMLVDIPVGALGNPRSSYGLGSACYLSGKNLLYSLYVNTTESSWGKEEKEEVLSKLEIACEYIEDCAEQYHTKVELVYDWQENRNLTGNARVKFPICDQYDFVDKLDEEIALWVESKVDYEGLMEEYDAEGIALLVFVNNPVSSYAIVYDGIDNPKESVILEGEETPAAYAHEILHVFGAHDLYKDAEYTKEVTDYVKKAYPLEIMYTVADERGRKYDDKIVNVVSPITAYHLGWIDYTEEIDIFPQLKRKQKNERGKGL
ncbi:MAG: hypothetical protein HDQ97_01130 [Lachnospiraceae bacterium]|nr:hypothetical protein [Lachnospiraceae bacterium]